MKGSRSGRAASLLLAGTLAIALSVPVGAPAALADTSGGATGSQTQESSTGTWTGAAGGETGDGRIDLSYDTTGGTWKDGRDDAHAEHQNGSYLVTVPTKIAWTGMDVGTVDASADYNVNVRGVIRSGDTVRLAATPEDFTLSGDAVGGISADVTQGKVAGGDTATWTVDDASRQDASGDVVGTDATDSVKLSGTVKQAGDYMGHVSYVAGEERPAVKAKAFASMTDSELESLFAGNAQPDLSAWHVGDKRTVTLTDGHEYTMVLMDAQPYERASDETRTPHFIWGFQELLSDTQRMNATYNNSGGWDATEMRTWLNTDVYDKLPAWLREATKHVKVVSDVGTATTGTTTSEDKLFIPAGKEVFGGVYSWDRSSGIPQLHQWEWYQTASNRVKKLNGSADWWWERSSGDYDTGYFCEAGMDGTSSDYYAYYTGGVAVSGCI